MFSSGEEGSWLVPERAEPMVFIRRLLGTLSSKDLGTHPQLRRRIHLKQRQQLKAAIGGCTELRVTGFPLNKKPGVISA